MKQTRISNTDLSVSRVSFGTGSLHHLFSRAGRAKVLRAALDLGITHFDTSPYYGNGLAEIDLGQLLKERRDEVTVTTKVGMYPPLLTYPSSTAVWATKVAGKFLPQLNRARVDFDLSVAEQSLHRSLRRMNTDYIDLLMLHEPVPQGIDADGILQWFESKRREGKIRHWGTAGQADCMSTWVEDNHPICKVIQTRDSLAQQQANFVHTAGRPLQFTYGYMSGAARNARGANVYQDALDRNRQGSVIVSTRRIDRIRTVTKLKS